MTNPPLPSPELEAQERMAVRYIPVMSRSGIDFKLVWLLFGLFKHVKNIRSGYWKVFAKEKTPRASKMVSWESSVEVGYHSSING